MKSWDEAREDLRRAVAQGTAPDDACAALDRALAEGRRVEAIRLLRQYGIDIGDP